ncbi:hypothetical protein [Alkalispirochaeta alkalica]|uniref:hypothetical protein n=1 Tax=Alkalispirochaeta alkalica TaxID=46356 RepID=UPI00037B5C70|nr:hypothetical protein [Alkalispirochaeta alkalica]
MSTPDHSNLSKITSAEPGRGSRDEKESAPGLRVIPYFSPISRTNCYVVAGRDSSEAILLDPVHLDNELYSLLLQHNLTVRWVLVTHPEAYMRHALRTLCRIYSYQLVAGTNDMFGITCEHLVPEEVNTLEIGGLRLQALPVLPHSTSSYMYRLGELLFTGTIVHAGTLGETPSSYNEELLVATMKDMIFTIPRAEREMILLPAVGPPSTIRAEQHLSPYYRDHCEPA